MTDLIVVQQDNHWQRLKALVLDSVGGPKDFCQILLACVRDRSDES